MFETVVILLLKFAKNTVTDLGILKQADFPQCLAYEFLARLTEQFNHVGISIGQHSAFGVEQKYTVWRCLEKPSVTHFGGVESRSGPRLEQIGAGEKQAYEHADKQHGGNQLTIGCGIELRFAAKHQGPGPSSHIHRCGG